MRPIFIFPIFLFFAHFHPKLAQWDGLDEEQLEGIENQEENWFRSESESNEQPRKPTKQIQIFVPPRNRRPPPPPPPPPQSPQQNRPPPSQPAPQQESASPAAEPTNELIAPADLTEEEKAARRRAYLQFLGQLEDAKSQLPGLQGRWGSRITENLVYLAQQQLQILNGDEQGPEEADKIFLGDGPLNLRQIQQGVSDSREDELQPVGRFNLNELGVSEDVPESARFKRQQDEGLVSAVTCQEFVFDARQKWPQCAQIIGNVRDQSLCGDCWAVSASSAFSDRRCIQKVKAGQPIDDEEPFFSAYDTAICSDAATDKKDGCKGGSSAMAWRWYTNSGVVSGGNNAQQNTSSGPQGGCKPYPFPPTAIADKGEYQALNSECFATCTNSEAANNNNPPRAKARSWNYLYGANGWEEVMRNEIFENGSISASLMVFEDFKTYSSGVYNQVMGNQLGGHAIRLIGYGNITCSDGTSQKYWLGVNSWNTEWGLNGLFKIARGVDMCGIESRQIAYGIPIV